MGADRLVAVQAGLLNGGVDVRALEECLVARRAFHLGHDFGGVVGGAKTIHRQQDEKSQQPVSSAHHDEEL